MIVVFHLLLAGLGLLLWGATYAIWTQTKAAHLVLRLAFWPACAVLYAAGYFLVLVGQGIDRWDDSSAWYWDTWLLFGSTAAVAAGYALTRFAGALGSVLSLMPVAYVGYLVWYYVSN